MPSPPSPGETCTRHTQGSGMKRKHVHQWAKCVYALHPTCVVLGLSQSLSTRRRRALLIVTLTRPPPPCTPTPRRTPPGKPWGERECRGAVSAWPSVPGQGSSCLCAYVSLSARQALLCPGPLAPSLCLGDMLSEAPCDTCRERVSPKGHPRLGCCVDTAPCWALPADSADPRHPPHAW